jgi:segregation and condensation protein B
MERSEQRKVVEALVLASAEPIAAARIAQIAPECTPSLAKELVQELNEEYAEAERAFEIWEVAGGYQLRTRAEFSGYLQQLQKHRPLRLSRAALETLSIVAYKQPVTRGEVEQVRGVDVGAVVKSLMERQLIRITGQREVPGRPMLYGTTRRFLEVFGLESLGGLPSLRELEEIARERGIENPDAVLGIDGVEGPTSESEQQGPPEGAQDGGQEGETQAFGTESVIEEGALRPTQAESAEDFDPEDAGEGELDAEIQGEEELDEEGFAGADESVGANTLSRFGHAEEPYSVFGADETPGGIATGEEIQDEGVILERE